MPLQQHRDRAIEPDPVPQRWQVGQPDDRGIADLRTVSGVAGPAWRRHLPLPHVEMADTALTGGTLGNPRIPQGMQRLARRGRAGRESGRWLGLPAVGEGIDILRNHAYRLLGS